MNINRPELIEKICSILNLPFSSEKQFFSKQDLEKIYIFLSLKCKAERKDIDE